MDVEPSEDVTRLAHKIRTARRDLDQVTGEMRRAVVRLDACGARGK